MTSAYKGEDLWPIQCPHCPNEFYEQIGRLKNGGIVECPGCGGNTFYQPDKFARMLDKAEKGIGDFGGRIRRGDETP